MSQWGPADFGYHDTQMTFEGFDAASIAVDGFDQHTTNGSIRRSLDYLAFQSPSAYDSIASETPPDIFTDDPSMSPRSHTSSIFDTNDLILHSPFRPDTDSYDSSFFDIHTDSIPKHELPNLDNRNDTFQAIPSQNDLLAYRPFADSPPHTRNSFSAASTSSQSDPNILDLVNPSGDIMADESESSPTSSSSQYEGRDHPFYRRAMEADGLYHCPMEADGTCDFPPKALKCEYHKHIDSHLKPFRCRKPGCANQAFSSVACRLRHEREMHKMHIAEQFLCRYDGPCERKQTGSGFARSFNRDDHEKRVHHIFREDPRSKGRPKHALSDISNTHPSLRRNRGDNSISNESSTSTVGTIAPTSPEPTRLQKQPAPVNVPQTASSIDSFTLLTDLPGKSSFKSPPNSTLSQAQVTPGLPVTKRVRFSKSVVKSNSIGSPGYTSKRHPECVRQWAEHARKLRDLVLRLPEFPDNLSDGVIHSINQETQELLSLLSDIYF